MAATDFSPQTAGRQMISAIPRVRQDKTIADVIKMLLEEASTFESVDYVYVVDDDEILQGVMSIRELLRSSDKDVEIEKVMKKELVKASPSTEQEEMVYLALSHSIKAVPVVNDAGQILGVVPHDTILKIFNEEVREDIFTFGGVFHRVGMEFSTIKSSASLMFRKRLPWLIIGVFGGGLTASIVGAFENVLSTLLSLAAFIPVMAFLSDAAGTQSETLAVRSLALEPKLSRRDYFLREFKVALSLALICGLLIGLVALLGWRMPLLGLIVGLSMFLGILAAVFVSTSLPFLFRRLDLDPAFASGPFATMISDAVTIVVYFVIASQVLAYFGST